MSSINDPDKTQRINKRLTVGNKNPPIGGQRKENYGASNIHLIEQVYCFGASGSQGGGRQAPKFNIQPPQGVTVSYLIRGIPVPEAMLKGVTVSETQAFANDVAAGIAVAHPEVFSASVAHAPTQGAIISIGGHLVVGIPAPLHPMEIDK